MATLLLIEDSETHRAGIRGALETAGVFDRILEASDGMEGLKRLLSGAVDVVLCDVEMPRLDGAKLLQAKEARAGDIPILFLSGATSMERRVRLLEAGASDIIAKPFDPAELVARLRLHLKIRRLQSELLEKNEMLSRLSSTDALTELRTRRYFDEMLQLEWLRARRYGTPLALWMADLDHFKRVNDRHGHPTGDTVLRRIAGLLRVSLRATDVAGRYGGEEIAVLMPQNRARGARVLAERFRGCTAAVRFESPGGEPFSVTVSIGVAELCAPHESAADLVAAADAALYQAKQAGRDRVVVAGE